MSSRLRNRLLWLALLVTIAVLAVQFESTLYMGAGRLTVEDGEPGTVLLRWRGRIEAPMRARLEEAFKAHKGRAQTFVLTLSSPGGSVGHGGEVIRLLRTIRKTHHLETRLEASGTCASMCVPVYLQGQTRVASPASRWMFHEVSLRDAVTDEAIEIGPNDRAKHTDRLFDNYFRPAGVPEPWITAMRQQMRGRDVWRTGRQLIEERAGIIQQPL